LLARLAGKRRATTIARAPYVLSRSTKTVGLRARLPARRALRRRSSLTATAKVTTRHAGARSGSRSKRVKLVRRG